MSDILVVAPHPDDETFGCGGALLKARQASAKLHWLILTEMTASSGYSNERIATRECEIEAVSKAFGFQSVHRLGYETAALDVAPIGEVVKKIADIFAQVHPSDVYLPFPGDAHTDHKISFDAALSCTKWFRAPYVRRVLAYETLSETDIVRRPGGLDFIPSVYENITDWSAKKKSIIGLYGEEVGDAPFPRSLEIVDAKEKVRGAEAGCAAAEAFMLLKEVRP
jgi:LmbE family N-acetylglucosaminyl deacetylase|tara:strand:+ start:4167 stop:4838 length:672 start_codon:yes stop_codon:yes gene_type:complete